MSSSSSSFLRDSKVRLISSDSQDTNDGDSTFTYLFNFCVFMVFGAAPNWVFATALAQEIPYFEHNLPGGLCIATYMNAAANIGLVAVFVYLTVNHYYPIRQSVAICSLLFLCIFGTFLTAFSYSIVAFNAPVLLFTCCGIGGIVGALSAVIMSPFLMFYKNDYISAARCGGSAGIVLTAIIAIPQDPGSQHERFSAENYFIVFGCLLSLSVVAFYYIVYAKVGLRDQNVSPFDEKVDVRKSHHGLEDLTTSVVSVQSMASLGSLIVISPLFTGDESESDQNKRDIGTKADQVWWSSSACSKSLIDFIFPCSFIDSIPWLRAALPYMLTVGWVDLNTWGMISALIPFAMANVSTHGGAQNLAIAYEIGAVALVMGDLLTTRCRWPFHISLTIFTACSFTIYAASFGLIHTGDGSFAPIMIAIFSINRLQEEYLLTQSYRAVASELPLQHREAAARAVGLTDQLMTTLGAVFSTALVSGLASC